MTKRMTWERREITFVHQYWVVGERLLDEDRLDGWYVSTWSDSVPILGYWVQEGRFYDAIINWMTRTTINLEISGEIALDPEREQVSLEAMNQWGHAAVQEQPLEFAAA